MYEHRAGAELDELNEGSPGLSIAGRVVTFSSDMASPPGLKEGRTRRTFGRIGVAWAVAGVMLATAAGLAFVTIRQGRSLSEQTVIATGLRADVAVAEEAGHQLRGRVGELDRRLEELTDENDRLSGALDTCRHAIDLDQRFIDASNNIMSAQSEKAFIRALERADALYYEAEFARGECVAQADPNVAL